MGRKKESQNVEQTGQQAVPESGAAMLADAGVSAEKQPDPVSGDQGEQAVEGAGEHPPADPVAAVEGTAAAMGATPAEAEGVSNVEATQQSDEGAETAAAQGAGLSDGQAGGGEPAVSDDQERQTVAPLYRSHKQVRALKLSDIERNNETGQVLLTPEDKRYEPFEPPAEWYARFHGSDADTGYFVQYEDGFSSWSPTKAFEDGYTLMRDAGSVADPEVTGAPVKLHCTGCGRVIDYDRKVDRDLPANVVRIESTVCDQCDNGDFGTETWYDAAGDVVVPRHELEEHFEGSWKLDVAELARAVAGGARLFADGGMVTAYQDVFDREEAAIMADFVRDNPDAPAEAMFIHLSLVKRYPRTVPNAVDTFVLSLFHHACKAAHQFAAQLAAEKTPR